MKKYVRILLVFFMVIFYCVIFNGCNSKVKDHDPIHLTAAHLVLNGIELSDTMSMDELIENFTLKTSGYLADTESDTSYIIGENEIIIEDNNVIPIVLFFDSNEQCIRLHRIFIDEKNDKYNKTSINGMTLGEYKYDDFIENVYDKNAYTVTKDEKNTKEIKVSFYFYDGYLTFFKGTLSSIKLIYRQIVPAFYNQDKEASIIITDKTTEQAKYAQYIFGKDDASAYVDYITDNSNGTVTRMFNINSICRKYITINPAESPRL